MNLSIDDYLEHGEYGVGHCMNCGEPRDCCEPDAREYECEACGQHKVYGSDELLVMGAYQ